MFLAATASLAIPNESHGAFISLQLPGIDLSAGASVPAVIVGPGGSTVEQTVVYNPSVGGFDINADLVGVDASIYFPTLNTGYVWYDGHWVDHEGFYWNNGARVYIGHPHWNEYWGGYWGRHHHWDGHHHPHPVYMHGDHRR